MPRNPAAGVLQRLSTQSEPMDAPFDGAFDEPGLFEHLEVLRNRRLGGAEPAAELAGASGVALRQRMNHRTAGAVGQSSKCVIEAGGASHSHMTIYFSTHERKEDQQGSRTAPWQ